MLFWERHWPIWQRYWSALHGSLFLVQNSAARYEDFKNMQIEMEVEPRNFQQHTEVWWLSMGPSIKRILEQWDAIIHFVVELAKDPRTIPKSISYRGVYMMLRPKEKLVTRDSLEFFNQIIPVFERFLFLFQKSCPVVHILYDNLCNILIKFLRRLINPQGLDNKYGSDLASVDSTKFQLPGKEIVMGKAQESYWRIWQLINRILPCLELGHFSRLQHHIWKKNYL